MIPFKEIVEAFKGNPGMVAEFDALREKLGAAEAQIKQLNADLVAQKEKAATELAAEKASLAGIQAQLKEQTDLAASMAESLNKHKADIEAFEVAIKAKDEEIKKLEAAALKEKQTSATIIASIGVDPISPDKPAADTKQPGFRELVLKKMADEPKLSKSQAISKTMKENPEIYTKWLQDGGGSI